MWIPSSLTEASPTSMTVPEFVPCRAPDKQGFNGVTTFASFKPKTIFDVYN